jgi:lipopolysaccharide/colanic/teichoic acid biosynthesis glycosyltransferase
MCLDSIQFSGLRDQQSTQQGAGLIVTPQVEHDFLWEAGKRTLTHLPDSPTPKEHKQSTFLPRYISTWCMSRGKRSFDLVLSLTALILFAPLMLVIGWLIKITSKGPVLFRQERVGLNQRSFTILKFRTMKHRNPHDDHGSKVTKQGDPRLTTVGILLRRLKLDELPQLINVVRGDMSFVGPRPKIPQHENLHMLCRPGITGAATVVFSHEENLLAEIPEEFVEHYVMSVLNPEKCRLDSHYIETARLSTDLKILVHTLFKLSNEPKLIQAQHSTLASQEKTSIENSVLYNVNYGENMEFSTQEIL